MGNDNVNYFFVGFFVGLIACLVVIALTMGETIPKGLTKVQPAPQSPNTRYVPVFVDGDKITVDCQHPQVFCDDEGA